MKALVIGFMVLMATSFSYASEKCATAVTAFISYDEMFVNFDGSCTYIRPTLLMKGDYLPLGRVDVYSDSNKDNGIGFCALIGRNSLVEAVMGDSGLAPTLQLTEQGSFLGIEINTTKTLEITCGSK